MVLVVSDKEKDTSSTSGMETSRLTSLLLQHRASHIVQQRLDEIEQAYLNKDFETFGRITMQDSNQFHAVCLDTYPPIFYMNDVSKSIIKLVHAFNEQMGKVVAAYTFDAGPNAVIYTLDEESCVCMIVCPRNEMTRLHAMGRVPRAGDVKYVFVTKSGPGPVRQPLEESLLDPATGGLVEPGPRHKRMRIGDA